MNIFLVTIVFLASFRAYADFQPDFAASERSFRETLTALVRADTTNPPGNEARAVKILSERLKKEKIPFTVVEFAPGRQNIVARLKGSGAKKPLLLLAHIDVVGTKDQKWSVPDHDVTEKDGYLYGRGVLDDLAMAVANLETFIQLKRSGLTLSRDVILALTGDEESGGSGIRYLLKNRPELLDAEISLNEGGGIVLNDEGKVTSAELGVAEKIYVDLELITRGETGHSSRPRKNNSIYRLAKALDKLAGYHEEERLIPVTRAYLKAQAGLEKPAMKRAMTALANARGKLPEAALKTVRQDPVWSPLLHTTCVATMLSAGTKVNALPPEAHANVNCRLLPDETPQQARERLIKIVADPEVKVELAGDFGSAPASPETGLVPTAVRDLIAETYPGVPVIPTIEMGATDSRFLRAKGVASYGFSTIAGSEKDGLRAHGIDERIPAASIRPGLELAYRLTLKLAH